MKQLQISVRFLWISLPILWNFSNTPSAKNSDLSSHSLRAQLLLDLKSSNCLWKISSTTAVHFAEIIQTKIRSIFLFICLFHKIAVTMACYTHNWFWTKCRAKYGGAASNNWRLDKFFLVSTPTFNSTDLSLIFIVHVLNTARTLSVDITITVLLCIRLRHQERTPFIPLSCRVIRERHWYNWIGQWII